MVVGVSVNKYNLSTRMVDFFNVVKIEYLCRSCAKWKNITFFFLEVFLHLNALHELTI